MAVVAGPSTPAVPEVDTWATVVGKGKGKGKGVGKSSAPSTSSANAPAARTAAAPAPVARASAARNPTVRAPAARAPTARAHEARAPVARAPMARAPAARAPTARASTARDPATRTPMARAPKARSAAVARPAATAAGIAKTALHPPKTAAIVLSLRPEAAEKGVTYSAVLQKAQEAVDIQEMGIDRPRFRQTATGARMIEISGSQHSDKADRLAERLRGVLSEVATIARPVKSTDLRIVGLDDAATTEKVAAAVAKAGSCAVEAVKVGGISPRANGAGSTIVSCPVAAAKAVLNKGRLLIGWSSVQVVAMGERPMRCFKCLGLGHTRPQCTATADRGDLCFRCGSAGHRAASCQKTVPRCAICAESGRPSGHTMGGRSCVPPKTKGKALRIQASPASAPSAPTQAAPVATPVAAPEEARPAACEEVVMSE